MEELTAKLAGSFGVSHDPNQTSSPHPRYSQYKMKTTKHDQESRRSRLLEIQKSARFNFTNHIRKLTDGDWTESIEEDEEADKDADASEEISEDMDVEVKLRRPGRYYKDQLMMSEWLVEVPADFNTEWIAVLCPVAKRCLVVASRGQTKAFSKNGYCINSFPSHLPGGYRRNKSRDATILDCLYSEAQQTYYILDLMCWNGHTVYDSETEFRFYWLHEKMQEFNALGVQSKTNPCKFVALPSFRCVQEDIATAVSDASFEIDGLLFFHKRTHYTFGSTPLVVWLKPYMLQEILDITVPETQMTHRPNDYTNYANHMKKVEQDRLAYQKKIEERKNGQSSQSGRGRGQGRGKGRGRGQFNRGKDNMEVSFTDEQKDGECVEEAEIETGTEESQPVSPVVLEKTEANS